MADTKAEQTPALKKAGDQQAQPSNMAELLKQMAAMQEELKALKAAPATIDPNMVTKEEAMAMANKAVVDALMSQKPAAAAPVTIVSDSSGGAPPQLRPILYVPEPQDMLKEPITYEVQMRSFFLGPYTDPNTGVFYDTPGHNHLSFRLVGARQEGDRSRVCSRLTIKDKKWRDAIESRSDFGTVIVRRGDSVLTYDGMVMAASEKWRNHIMGMTRVELTTAIDKMNREAGSVVVPFSENENQMRHNLIGYYVKQETGYQSPAGAVSRPTTAEEAVEAHVLG